MNNNLQTLRVNDWVLKVRLPEGDGDYPVFLLNHGWTGDEDSMWVFATRLPPDAILIAPRAPYRSKLGGYSWVEQKSGDWPWLGDFRPAVEAYLKLLENLTEYMEADLSRVNLVGFSQGGAFSYAFALLHPERVDMLAGLASFLPERCEEIVKERSLVDVPVFVGHGTEDELVPIEMARRSVRMLMQAGADVSYCETEVGHKLGADCFRAFEDFFR